jgi:hypothetical protein
MTQGLLPIFLQLYESFTIKHNLLERSRKLHSNVTHPLTKSLQQELKALDSLRCEGVAFAEKQCHKLRTGQVGFSPEIQAKRLYILAWSLLKKRSIGLRISSRLLQCTMFKAKLETNIKHAGAPLIQEHLTNAYRHYYSLKRSHTDLRKTHMAQLAEVLAQEKNLEKVQVLRSLREREMQRTTIRKIRLL